MGDVQHPQRIGDFYTQTVLPALAEHLDQAFPEFGWRRDQRGWVATNQQHTHARLGVRADRVVVHGPAPPGFLIHGGDAMLWTAYVNGGSIPRGPQFIHAVEELARRAGIDPSPISRDQPRDRRTELLDAFFQLCQRHLASDAGTTGRAYLERRSFPEEALTDSGIGLVPPADRTRELLNRAGYKDAELAAAGILADSRWPGRLCGAWRTEYGRIGTFWARAIDDAEAAGTRYLYLRGASRTNLPPYGLYELLSRPGEPCRQLVLVEGFIDLHQLRAHGIDNIAALGGTSIRQQTFERLHRRGITTVTLCLDNDNAGRAATARAVEQAARARHSPDVYVIDPERLTPAKDPDELVRQRGPDAWHELIETRSCAIAWRAHELADISNDAPAPQRRAALARAGAWLGSLPPRLALEQEDAIRALADRCRYSPDAVERAFHARYWAAPAHTHELPGGR